MAAGGRDGGSPYVRLVNAWATGMTVRTVPAQLREYIFLTAFPGYTREEMRNEPAWWVNRMIETHALVKRGEGEQIKRASRSKGRGR